MRIERDESIVSWTQVAAIFQAVGWGERDPDDLRVAFARSTFKAFAYEGTELVGCGRSIDDGQYYATLVDVVVAPSHQRQGIGRAIVMDLQSRMSSFLIVTATAALEVQPFYRRLGWRHQATAMILPRSEEQERLNCADEAMPQNSRHRGIPN